MGLFLIWHCVFALVCGAIAGDKNRSGITWLILGFFFGFFALIVIAYLPEKNK